MRVRPITEKQETIATARIDFRLRVFPVDSEPPGGFGLCSLPPSVAMSGLPNSFWRTEMNLKLASAMGAALALVASLGMADIPRAQAAQNVHVRGTIASL